MKEYTKIFWGMLLIVFGIIIGINSLGIADIEIFFDGWWTLFIIIPSLISFFNDDDKRGSLVGLVIGIVLLLVARDVISLSLFFKLLFPGILVFIGLSIVWDEIFGSPVKEKVKKANFSENNSYSAVFGENKCKVTKEFKGASLDAVFGEVSLDLREAKIEEGAVLKVSAIFGEARVILPSDVVIKTKETKIFGSVDKKEKKEKKEEKDKKVKTIYIDAFSLFGGIDIK